MGGYLLLRVLAVEEMDRKLEETGRIAGDISWALKMSGVL